MGQVIVFSDRTSDGETEATDGRDAQTEAASTHVAYRFPA